MLCHIVVQVNVLLFNVVSVFFASVGAIFCESGHGLGLYCLSCFFLQMLLLGRSHFNLLVLVVSIFVFGVVGVFVVAMPCQSLCTGVGFAFWLLAPY